MEKFDTYLMGTSDPLGLQKSFIIECHSKVEKDFTDVHLSDYMYDIGNELHDTRHISNMILSKNIRDLDEDPTSIVKSNTCEDENHSSVSMVVCENGNQSTAKDIRPDSPGNTVLVTELTSSDENTVSNDKSSIKRPSSEESGDLVLSNESNSNIDNIENLTNNNENDKTYYNDSDSERTSLLNNQDQKVNNSVNGKFLLKKYIHSSDNSKNTERSHCPVKKNYSLDLENRRLEDQIAPRRASAGVKNTALIPRSEQYHRHPLLEKNENGLSELESLLKEKENEILVRQSFSIDKKEKTADNNADESTEEERSPNEETDRKIEMQLAKRMSFKFQPRISQYEKHLLHSVIVDKDKDGKTELERMLADSEQGLDNKVYSESTNDFNDGIPPQINITNHQNESVGLIEKNDDNEKSEILTDNQDNNFVAETEKENYHNDNVTQTAVSRSFSEDKYCADMETELLPHTDEDQTSRKISRHKFSSISSSNKGCCDIL